MFNLLVSFLNNLASVAHKNFIVAIFVGFSTLGVYGQASLEFFASSQPSISVGPTTGPQTATLRLNSDNPLGNTIGTANTIVNVTASLSNQQFTGVNTGPGSPVIMFGGAANPSGSSILSANIFGEMNSIGSPVNTNYSNVPSEATQGLDIGVNHAFLLLTSVRHWAGTSTSHPPLNSPPRYMADLTITFSSPVTNPLLHFVGIGATLSGATGRSITTEFGLANPGLTLTKVSGNGSINIDSDIFIVNRTADMSPSCSTNLAGCGTVRVNGSNITSLTFLVFVRGAGSSARDWGLVADHNGDAWMFSTSLPQAYNLSGRVFSDVNALNDETVNGTGFNNPSGIQLYANLVDPTDGSVIGSVPVATDGTYIFTGIPGSGVNYRVEISTMQGVSLQTSPPISLPTNWTHTGENHGTGVGNDGNPDGTLGINVANSDITNVNFGIKLFNPSASNVSLSGRVLTASGRPIPNARVTLIQTAGTSRTVLTGAFGYFTFSSVPAGQTVIVTVGGSKRYTFSESVYTLSLTDDLQGVEFFSNEP